MRSVSRKVGFRIGAALLGVSFVVASAHGTPNVETVARGHFRAGQAMYDTARYLDAVREFDAGYQQVKRPRFLLNIGQSYRAAGYLGAARDYYQRFLDEAPPTAPDRGAVTALLVEISAVIAAKGPGPTPPPIVASPQIVTKLVIENVAAPPPKRWPIWLGVGVAAAVVVGAVVVGVVIGTRGGETMLPTQNARN